MNIWQYDAGAEMALVQPAGLGWTIKPFLGLGAGARTYNYASRALKDATCTAAYGAAGSEFQYSLFALRLEADWISGIHESNVEQARRR